MVQRQFEEEAKEGLMEETTLGQAIERFGRALVIAATGAIEKKGRTGEVRVIFDASNGVRINYYIRVRDQVKCPGPGDVKAVLHEMSQEDGGHYGITYDVSKAHRRVPVLEEEWGRQACQIKGTAAAAVKARKKLEGQVAYRNREEKGTPIPAPCGEPYRKTDFTAEELAQPLWLNCVGTFGVASAGYWWGRAGAAVERLTHYLQGLEHALWQLLYSDDGWVTGRSRYAERDLLFHLFILVILGTPMAWHKFRGGAVLEWIGYALDLKRFELGVSELRLSWVVKWLADKVEEVVVPLGEMREGLGRIQFVAGPLEHLRPFLGPLYAWASAAPRHARPRIPPTIALIMRLMIRELQAGGMASCSERGQDLGEVFRLDAKAEGDSVAIGGWLSKGSGCTKKAPWFSVSLNRRNAPWAFMKGETFRVIASLELLGALVGLMVLLPLVDQGPGEASALLGLSCGTDNLGNTFLLDRMLTTKYPLGVILMELAHQCRVRRVALRAAWLPRLQNEEADALTNLDFRHFDAARRIQVDLGKLKFGILHDLFKEGEDYVAKLEALKAAAKSGHLEVASGARKRLAGDKLRDRQLWG